MNATATLTNRETEVAELFAWGAAKKDISRILFISERTVENHARSIFDKIGCGKVNELSAWWFCTRFGISFDLSPFKRSIIASCMLVLVIFQIAIRCDVLRTYRSKNVTSSIRYIQVAQQGGDIARNARMELEVKTGKPYLTPQCKRWHYVERKRRFYKKKIRNKERCSRVKSKFKEVDSFFEVYPCAIAH
jgi:Response regulator containing a CheY-like receiver domain and an HTH DNA-binding domain